MNGIDRVVVAHNPVAGSSDPSTRDVLAQVELACQALSALGIDWSVLAATRRGFHRRLPSQPGAVVFNLVEAPPGDPAVHPGTAAVLELLGLPFTGSAAAALWLTTDKVVTRAVLAAAGLPIAPGCALEPAAGEQAARELLSPVPGPWILKPACEDASLGLEGASVLDDPSAVVERAEGLGRRFPGQRILVEQYLPGCELNVSLLASPDGLVALPVAEMVFEDWPAEMPRVLGYEAKWEPDSFAYRHTVRRFVSDAGLESRAIALAQAAARACGLRGYGRVDLRADAQGELRILEVNANPCLAADAGFMSAAERSGLTAEQVVARLLDAALADHARRLASRGAVDRVSAPEAVSRPAWRSPARSRSVARDRSLSRHRSSQP